MGLYVFVGLKADISYLEIQATGHQQQEMQAVMKLMLTSVIGLLQSL